MSGKYTGRWVLLLGAVFGLTAVALGAAGAHLLTDLPDGMRQTFATGVRYQMWHALALLVIGVLQVLQPHNARLRWSAWLMVAGVMLFPGSLYALVFFQWPGFAWLAPIGGSCLLLGWLALVWAVLLTTH